MGLDFIRKIAPTFHKGLDRALVKLHTPDLFKRGPVQESRAYAARMRPGKNLSPGQELSIRIDNGKVVALRDMEVVAEFISPPDELVEAIRASFGEACGVVREVHELAEIAEISVC